MKNKKLFAILTLVCFMFTLMPVAAFAADPQISYIYAEDKNVEVDDAVELTIDLSAADATTVYVWFEEAANVPSTALVGEVTAAGAVVAAADANGILAVDVTRVADKELYVAFNRAGNYELHAAIDVNPLATYPTDTKAESVAKVADAELKTQSGYDVVVVTSETESSKYVLGLGAGLTAVKGNEWTGNPYIEDKGVAEMTASGINGAAVDTVTLTVHKAWVKTGTPATIAGVGPTVYAKDVEIDTTSGVDVTNVEVKRSGTITFDVTANKAGTHKIYITIGDFDATIKVDATNGEADSIVVDAAPKTPINHDNVKYAAAVSTANRGDLSNYLTFEIFDANGNEITSANSGIAKAMNSNAATVVGEAGSYPYRNYVALTEKPADSDLTSKNLFLLNGTKGWTIGNDAGFDEEGTYSFKVVLENGEYATASITVKEAGDPVALSVTYDVDSVQLGAEIAPKNISWLDKNYVATTAVVGRDVEIAVTGAAVASVAADGTITVKDDEKYVGSEIKVTVVDEENNLVATKVLTVAAEAKELVFDVNAIPVNATKTVEVSLVDEDGNTVGLQNVTTYEAYAIVLPNDINAEADVVVGSIDLVKGTFDVAVSADAVGTFEVQAVLKAEIANVVRYFTGTQEIKVGATGIEDTVVMSIGANKIVVNDEVVAIDAAPMIKDSRTFVPFRALAEAFGATVEFDAATQAVVAELDGTKVVMTIGSEVYTVNGVAKTADVAPFISDSRTMVPVRFAAEAFGITVTPIYAEDGSVADVLFTK